MNSRSYRTQVEQAISGAQGLANNLPLSSLRAFSFAIPPIREQGEIVEHLRAPVEAALTAIVRIECEISHLREYRTRLIADVVTGKLDVRDAAAQLPDMSTERKQSEEDVVTLDIEVERDDHLEPEATEVGE